MLPDCPASWYFICQERNLNRGPIARIIGGKEYVIFRAKSGQISVLDGRCPHMNARLSLGKISGEHLQCPLHGWCFDGAGRCQSIPTQENIPDGIKTQSYPVEVRHGNVFVFNQEKALFPLPFFNGANSTEFQCSRPFTAIIECPWYGVSGNFFDEQHFRTAHDRRLTSFSELPQPHHFAKRIVGTFDVIGETTCDRLWRKLLGPEVTLDHTQWMGIFSCTESRFAKTTSYGMISLNPLPHGKTELTLFSLVKQGHSLLTSPLASISAELRRYFIARFLSDDWQILNGVDYKSRTTIAADLRVREYLNWLEKVASERV